MVLVVKKQWKGEHKEGVLGVQHQWIILLLLLEYTKIIQVTFVSAALCLGNSGT